MKNKNNTPRKQSFTIVNVDGTSAGKVDLFTKGNLTLSNAANDPFLEITRDALDEYTIKIVRPFFLIDRPDKEMLAYWVGGGK